MIKKIISLIIILLLLGVSLYSQSKETFKVIVPISLISDNLQVRKCENIKDEKQTYFYSDSIFTVVEVVKPDSCIIKLYNTTNDTVYLFDSYLYDANYMSEYLHHYDKKEKKCILSLLPLVRYLDFKRSDLIVLGSNKVVSNFQVLYSFKPVYPHSCLPISLKKKVFDTAYVKRFDSQKYIGQKHMKFKKLDNIQCEHKVLELAIYDKESYSLLKKREKNYVFFNYQDVQDALSYKKVEVEIE